MPDRPLRAVGSDERPETPPPATLKEAVKASERALLVKLRDKIASDIDSGVPPHTLAPLSRQLLEIDKQIRGIDLRAAQESARSNSGSVDNSYDASAV